MISTARASLLTGAYETLGTGGLIRAAEFTPRVTNGPMNDQIESAGQSITYDVLDFDATTEEAAHILLAMPDSWDLGTIKAKFYWDAKATASGDVVWGISGGHLADSGVIDTALGTEVTVTDTVLTVGDVHVTAATGAVTIAGTLALGGLVILEVARVAADGADTVAVDARLLGVSIQFKTLRSASGPAAW